MTKVNYLLFKEDKIMSNKTNEVMETTTEVMETEKVGFFTKVKGFCKKHKKGLIVGGALAAVTVGLIKVFSGSGDDCDIDFEDDVIDVDDVTEEIVE
jgi:hypothetical protein